MNKKLILLALALILLTGCGNKKEVVTETGPTATTKRSQIPTKVITPTENLEGKKMNPLTGIYVDEEIANRRPTAIVYNNLKVSLPQSGISQGELYYEVLAEAGITRIIAFAQKYDTERIGSIRSARHYFLDFVLDNDGIFVHHGGSAQAYKFIADNGIKDINGDVYEGTYFYRDKERLKRIASEHTSYTSSELIETAIEKLNIQKNHDEDFEPMFKFYDKDTNLVGGKTANEIKAFFSSYQQSVFKYDDKIKEYLKFQGEDKHVDEENDKQLSVKNIIVQFVNMAVFDDEGRRNVDLVSSGDGYLFTNGKYTNITWTKSSHFSPTKWYDEKGKQLEVNKGKTWICVFQKTGDLQITGEENIEETADDVLSN